MNYKHIKENSHFRDIRYMGLVILFLFMSLLITSCGKNRIDVSDFSSVQEYNRKEVIVGTADGYIFTASALKALPDAQIKVFDSRENVYKALRSGDIDAVVDDEAIIRAIMRSDKNVKITEDYIEPSDYGFIFPKNDKGRKLSEDFSRYLSDMEKSAELKALDAKWFGSSTANKTSDEIENLPGTNGVLRLAFDSSNVPFAYYSAGNAVGYDIDLAIGFCREYGYGLVVSEVGFTEMLDGVADETYDVGCGAITITDSRKELYNFSAPSYVGGISLCSYRIETSGGGVAGNNNGFWDNAARSFYNAFVEGARYKQFFNGILVTIIISMASALLGTFLGVLLYVLRVRGHFIIGLIIRFLTWIIYGIPALLIIIALYYRYYSTFYYGGVVASVIGFTIAFAVEIYRLIRDHAEKLDDGRFEKNYRLYFSDSKRFFKELFSRSEEGLLLDYRERIVTLIKSTAVVGYVSAYDMAKTFDVIRTESFEVAVPLFVTMFAYFILIRIIAGIIKP